jgi:hypothetical protein
LRTARRGPLLGVAFWSSFSPLVWPRRERVQRPGREGWSRAAAFGRCRRRARRAIAEGSFGANAEPQFRARPLSLNAGRGCMRHAPRARARRATEANSANAGRSPPPGGSAGRWERGRRGAQAEQGRGQRPPRSQKGDFGRRQLSRRVGGPGRERGRRRGAEAELIAPWPFGRWCRRARRALASGMTARAKAAGRGGLAETSGGVARMAICSDASLWALQILYVRVLALWPARGASRWETPSRGAV